MCRFDERLSANMVSNNERLGVPLKPRSKGQAPGPKAKLAGEAGGKVALTAHAPH